MTTPQTPAQQLAERDLTVAVTGPTGTFGTALVPMLEAEDRVARIVGTARSPVDPAERGWRRTTYRQGDVRDLDALTEAFAGADVVVHLAFLIVGGSPEQSRSVNVEGTLNAYRAAAAVGARRFVYASSVAAYGFHADNPVGLTEDWPTRPADRLFYAQEKAELEELLRAEAERTPDGPALYLLRPPIVLGPDAAGRKQLPGWLAALAPLARRLPRRLPPLPLPVPDLPVQLVHQDDVARALLLCVLGAGPPGAYNVAADTLSAADVVRLLGGVALPLPPGPAHAVARALASVPGLPQPAQWVEALAHPAVVDTSRARDLLGWRPQVSSAEALRQTFGLDAGGSA